MSINTDKEIYTEIKFILSSKKYLKRRHISIDELIHIYNVSAIPLRETLIRLAAEDILDYELGKGFYSKELSLQTIKNDYHLLFNTVQWCIDCSLCEVNYCKGFLDWVGSIENFFDIIKKNHDLYETTLNNSIMCISGDKRLYFLCNILNRTTIFRRHIHLLRNDISQCAHSIVELSKLISNNHSADAKKMLKLLEEERMETLQSEYHQLMSNSIEFDTVGL